MTARYQEGYEKGIHDSDALQILRTLLPIHAKADLLRYAPEARALAMLFWTHTTATEHQRKIWQSHPQNAYLLSTNFQTAQGFVQLREQLQEEVAVFVLRFQLHFSPTARAQSAEYLSLELAQSKLAFITSQSAENIQKQFTDALKKLGHMEDFDSTKVQFNDLIEQATKTDDMVFGLEEQWTLSKAWIYATLDQQADLHQHKHYVDEATALVIVSHSLPIRSSSISLNITVTDLLSDHIRIQNSSLSIALDEFNQRMSRYHSVDVPSFKRYHELRSSIMKQSKKELQLDAYTSRLLSSFVRNRLINEVYLPLIGDNFAKQMGTVAENKRTDLMGLLLLISPPGYGKTTLMEYVADRLGLVFMKINCPSLGHDVTSIDTENAPNATARQELEKLNLGLEMGNNVMLYLDDIQHTHPEFLQEFIALTDGTRHIEGVWKGESKTYDMRGKKFCVVMAGNPYTESGDVFKIPDMLANRADIYNLGDVLGGKEEQFALSYIENALTSNSILAPLALRDMQDVYKFVALANGEAVATSEFSHQYSGAEINEIVAVLKHLKVIQEVILQVNLQYIESAATAEDYRQEPPFKLQGSYRNMNKMTEKVSAVMNHTELMRLIGDHYIGEAQTLTSGAEEKLLKLALLRDAMTPEQETRWQHICSAFDSKQSQNIEGDPQMLAVRQLSQMADALEAIKLDMQQSDTADLIRPINRVAAAMQLLSKAWSAESEPKSENKQNT
jgi:hypothetical protein